MSWALAGVAAVLAAVGTWLAMDRTLTRILLGLGLWGHAAVVLLLVSGGPPGAVPIGSADELADRAASDQGLSDPLVQAFALTAIVITFAVTAYLLALAARSWQLTGDDRVRDDLEDARVAAAIDDDLPDAPLTEAALGELDHTSEQPAGANRPDGGPAGEGTTE